MEQFIGSWKSVHVENLEEYLTTIGAEDEVKAVLRVVTLYYTISQEDDTVVCDFHTVFTRQKFSFKLGEEYYRKTLDGRDCKVVVCLEGDRIIEVSKWNDSESNTIYEIKDGQLIQTLKYKDAVAVITYVKA